MYVLNMLPTVGYFRSIDCPSLAESGECQRPYCHFRHSYHAHSKSNLEVNYNSEAEATFQLTSFSVGFEPNSEASHKSVLHGARGAAVKKERSNYVKEVDYQTTTSKPVTDLEYDPLCNFNLKDKRAQAGENNDNSFNSKNSSSVIDLTEDGFANDNLVIDCSSNETEKANNIKKDLLADRTSKNLVKNTDCTRSSSIKDDVTVEKSSITIVISDSDSVNSDNVEFSSAEPPKSAVQDQPKHIAVVSNTTRKELGETNVKKESVKSDKKPVKSISERSKIKSKSLKKTISSEKLTIENKSKRKHELNKRKTVVSKNKKIKTEKSSDSSADIEKYVSKDEIEKLDKELNDVGMFDECYRIFQESSNLNTIKEPAPLLQKKQKDLEVKSNETASPIPEKPRRIAHAMAAKSAHNLNRDRKITKRFLTPQQAMMKRMETIRKEQEEHLLSSVLKRQSAVKNLTSENKQVNMSTPNKPSSLKFTSVNSLKKKRPFENLLSSKSSGTSQGTVVKGHRRSAHVPTQIEEDGIEKPRILPDRHSKVPVNIRQRFLNSFIDEYLRIFKSNRRKAFDAAKVEEKQCNERSKSKGIYLSLAASALKKLRATTPGENSGLAQKQSLKSSNQTQDAQISSTSVAFKSNNVRIAHGTSPNKAAVIKSKLKSAVKRQTSHNERVATTSRLCKGGFSLLQKEVQLTPEGEELYENLCRYLMTEQELADNGFPRPSDISGMCKFMVEKPRPDPDKSKKTCARCGKLFVLYRGGHFAVEDECTHHWGKAFSTKVGSHWEKRYSCCQAPIGTEGCTVGETHVHKDNAYDCNNYVQTLKKTKEKRNPGVYALDCEMAYTVNGLELIRVSVVNFDCQLVYDTLVQPKGKILDYNSRWSGLNEEDLKDVKTSLMDVQAVLLNRFSSDTILIGHSLESDLVALRIVHSSVIDTSVVFPHRLGPPYKRALRNLLAENLGIIIQNAVDEGHDSMEDASACIKLLKWKLNEDLKVHH